MTKKPITNVAASVRQRLLNKARAEGRVFQELATLYAMERFLFRLGQSRYADRFVLKGGLMTLTWAGEYGRLTRDIDLLGWGTASVESVTDRLREVIAVEVADGVVFDPGGAEGQRILSQAAYVGVRVRFAADLAGMLLPMQVDVGFGDAVVPEPDWFAYPELLDLGSPRLLGYPPAATLAEKVHAVVTLGLTNSRMKDYYDLWAAHRLGIVEPGAVQTALEHTFARRATPMPTELPIGLTDTFADAPDKQAQWRGFLRRSRLAEPSLAAAVSAARDLVGTALAKTSD